MKIFKVIYIQIHDFREVPKKYEMYILAESKDRAMQICHNKIDNRIFKEVEAMEVPPCWGINSPYRTPTHNKECVLS